MNDLERKKRLIVTALGAQQIYAQCHDECVDLKFFKHDLKMHSKNLVAKLERELMPIFGVLGNVEGGSPYSSAVESMEITLQNLATLPVEYWALVNKGILDIKRQIDEKDQAGADGVPNSETQGVESGVDGSDNVKIDKLKFTEVEEREDGKNKRASRKMQK
jgi:hypothetical protein